MIAWANAIEIIGFVLVYRYTRDFSSVSPWLNKSFLLLLFLSVCLFFIFGLFFPVSAGKSEQDLTMEAKTDQK